MERGTATQMGRLGLTQAARGLRTSPMAAGTYRATLCTELGQPLTVQQLERQEELGDGEVRVAPHYSSINFADILVVQGKYQAKPPMPFTPGSEYAGVVTEVGSDVTNLKAGDKVFGFALSGGMAEEIVVPSWSLSVVPASMSLDVASAIVCVYGTAWMALKHRAGIKAGDWVLVTGGAGGMGLATVDLATHVFDAKVIAVCSTDEKCAMAKKLGAAATINSSREKLKTAVMEATDGDGVDIVLDNVGGKMYDECLRCMAFEGRIMGIGFASGDIPKIPANILLVKNISALGVFWGNYTIYGQEMYQKSVQEVIKAYVAGKLHPHISKVFPLDQTNEAFQYVADRKSTGKVVINCKL